jgi:hypothetical protein
MTAIKRGDRGDSPGGGEFTFTPAEHPDRRRRGELLGLGAVLWPVGMVLVFWVLGTTFDLELALLITGVSFLFAALYLSFIARRTRRTVGAGAGPRA